MCQFSAARRPSSECAVMCIGARRRSSGAGCLMLMPTGWPAKSARMLKAAALSLFGVLAATLRTEAAAEKQCTDAHFEAAQLGQGRLEWPDTCSGQCRRSRRQISSESVPFCAFCVCVRRHVLCIGTVSSTTEPFVLQRLVLELLDDLLAMLLGFQAVSERLSTK